MGNSEARLHKMGNQRGKKNIDGNVKAIQSRIDKLEVKEKPKSINPIKIYIKDGLEIVSKNLIEKVSGEAGEICKYKCNPEHFPKNEPKKEG